MNKWINFKKRQPDKKELCDFLWNGDDEERGVWMLCSAKLKQQEDRDRDPDYWRKSVKLPDGIRTYRKA